MLRPVCSVIRSCAALNAGRLKSLGDVRGFGAQLLNSSHRSRCLIVITTSARVTQIAAQLKPSKCVVGRDSLAISPNALRTADTLRSMASSDAAVGDIGLIGARSRASTRLTLAGLAVMGQVRDCPVTTS